MILMKILVVNDDDSHAHAFQFTAENMKACLQHLVDIQFDMEDPEGAQKLLENPDATADEIWSFLMKWNGPCERSGGGRLYVVEVGDKWNFRYGPFS